MAIDMTPSQEIDLLNFLAEITVRESLDDLINYIVDNASRIFRVGRCSIYLTPDFVPQYNGELRTEAGLQPVSARSIGGPFVVMAGTSYPEKKEYIGSLFYPSGVDLTGWVFEQGRTLRMKDASDPEELKQVGLDASGGYINRDPDSSYGEVFPILYIPLRSRSQTLGVLKLHRPQNHQGFDDEAERVGTITAQILGSLIEKIQIAELQNRKILALAELGTEKSPEEVYQHITRNIPDMLDCSRAQLYLRSPREESVYLAYQNGAPFARENAPVYGPGDGFMGWIYKTGCPLSIDDMWKYWDPVELTDEVLARISDRCEIEDSDRRLAVLGNNKSFISGFEGPQPFVGVPILDSDGSIFGVLCAHSLSKSRQHAQRSKSFSEIDLQRLKTYASVIALAAQTERQRKRGELLFEMSRSVNVEVLFKLLASRLPDLMHDTDCFIFRLAHGSEPCLQLVETNRTRVPLTYTIGRGKTGFCALAESTVVIDHFGRGQINRRKVDQRFTSLRSSRPQDLLGELHNQFGDLVGVVRVENGTGCPEHVHAAFDQLCREQIVAKGKGLPSHQLEDYSKMDSRPSFSWVGVPIMVEANRLEGVIAIGRSLRRNPFSDDEVEFIQAISKTIAQVLGVLELQNQRKDLYVTLAHEINTYLTAIRADAENLMMETGSNQDLLQLSTHLAGQVDRLRLMTESILGVTSGKKIGVKVTKHSIFRPLMDAITMYKDEAAMRGFDIRLPSDKVHFPDMEMRLFELTLAFKNLLHNAIKYSFKPPRNLDRHRFISITGKWWDRERETYCVSIQNFGVGITEDEIRKGKIFQPFYRGILSEDRERTGSGLGLAYVNHVVRTMHHGDIRVESLPQGGEAYLTTFHVILPLRQPRTG